MPNKNKRLQFGRDYDAWGIIVDFGKGPEFLTDIFYSYADARDSLGKHLETYNAKIVRIKYVEVKQ